MRLFAAICCLSFAASAAARFAVVAGNDVGAAGRARLWYAEKDAERFGRALRELGDFPADHVMLVEGRSAAELREALAQTEQRIAAARSAGERVLFVLYFSGHAAAGGLELGDERLSYDELRAFLSRSTAETKVAIVDACEAGELTQVKGARPSAAVDFALPNEETVQGTALIASTAVGEAAQESAAIGGSFFTHHLEIALRGAADADGDGRVTLAEAFRYASARTVSGTSTTQAGPQHPTYDFRMSGRGDVVLADLRRAEATLRLPRDAGASYVLHGPRDFLAEVPGAATGVLLALPAGRYRIERRADGAVASASITLSRGDSLSLPPLVPTTYELARSKGGPLPWLAFAGGGVLSHPLGGAMPFVRAGGRGEWGAFALRLKLDLARRDAADVSLRYALTALDGSAALLAPLFAGPLLIEAGPEVGAGVAWQALQQGGSYSAPSLQAGAALSASLRAGPVRLGLDLGAGARGYRLDNAAVLRPAFSAALVIFHGL